MSAYYYNGKAARKRIGCSRECFRYLIETGPLKSKEQKLEAIDCINGMSITLILCLIS